MRLKTSLLLAAFALLVPVTPANTATGADLMRLAQAPNASASETVLDVLPEMVAAADMTLAEAAPETTPTDDDGGAAWLWGLIPLLLLGAVGWWALSRRGRESTQPAVPPEAAAVPPAAPVEPPPTPVTPVEPTPLVEEPSFSEPEPESIVAEVPAPEPEPEPEPELIAEVPAPEPEPPLEPAPVAGVPAPEPIDMDELAMAESEPTSELAPAPEPEALPPVEPVSADLPETAGPIAEAAGLAAVAGAAALAQGGNSEEDTNFPGAPESERLGRPIPEPPSDVPDAAEMATSAVASMASTEDQSAIEASKYNVVGRPVDHDIDLSSVDDGLPDLPGGYGESRIILMPRDPQWAYTYWDTPDEHKSALRQQGGQRLALRLYDVTDIDMNQQNPHSLQQYECDELARDWYLPIPVSDREYVSEIGYLTADGRWLLLARSNPIHVPPVYPSDWIEDHFATVTWQEDLRGKTLMTLIPPSRRSEGVHALHSNLFDLAQATEAQRVAGSLFGSMQHVPGSMMPQQSVSSYVFPSGVGMWAVPTMSGLTMSGAGFSASAPPIRPRKFWLVADAELIVYGATEPDASVTIGGQPIQLSPDGTFRFQMSFQDGTIDYPIMAVAADGEQSRSIHMTFDRETPERRTNTREEAQDEWPS